MYCFSVKTVTKKQDHHPCWWWSWPMEVLVPYSGKQGPARYVA